MTKAILVRFPDKLLESIDGYVKKGCYSSRSDLIREATRRMTLARELGLGAFADFKPWQGRSSVEIAKSLRKDIWDEMCKKAGTTDVDVVSKIHMEHLKKVKMP